VDCVVDETSARIGETLAGSVLGLDEGVRNLVEFTGCSPAEAVDAASQVPARLIGEEDRGMLRVGARADLVLLTRDLRVAATIVGGTVVHTATGAMPG
jgi:N-acetylglucosamine-6-phosphate deacetylase